MHAVLPVVPLTGSGPWSLAEVADASGLPYETVCRDVRRGRLPAERRGSAYRVTLCDLRQSQRPEYRRLAEDHREADGLRDGEVPARQGPCAAPRVARTLRPAGWLGERC